VKVQLMFTVAALTSAVAFAQDEAPAAPAGDPSTASIFRQLDQDKDGRISPAEAQASSVVSSSFSKADANGDGALTRDEFMSSFTTRSPNTPPPAVPSPPNQ
jgi:hypothetical protein